MDGDKYRRGFSVIWLRPAGSELRLPALGPCARNLAASCSETPTTANQKAIPANAALCPKLQRNKRR
jgi:hypothetical protein